MKDGPATLHLSNGDKLEYCYKSDQLQGSATYTWKDGSKETSEYVDGMKTGPSIKLSPNGDKEERSYVKGVLQGPAILHGHKEDVLEFAYKVSRQFFHFWSCLCYSTSLAFRTVFELVKPRIRGRTGPRS